MVQEIVTLCDVCYETDVRTKASTHLVAVAGGKWALELCDAHSAELIDPLADVAERLGQVVKNDGKAGRPKGGATPEPSTKRERKNSARTSEACLVCGVPSRNLTVHYRTVHSLDGLAEVYGLTCPLCEYQAQSTTALGVHGGRAHPEVGYGGGVPSLFRYASEHGDPHGVTAKVLANLGLASIPPLSPQAES